MYESITFLTEHWLVQFQVIPTWYQTPTSTVLLVLNLHVMFSVLTKKINLLNWIVRATPNESVDRPPLSSKILLKASDCVNSFIIHSASVRPSGQRSGIQKHDDLESPSLIAVLPSKRVAFPNMPSVAEVEPWGYLRGMAGSWDWVWYRWVHCQINISCKEGWHSWLRDSIFTRHIGVHGLSWSLFLF